MIVREFDASEFSRSLRSSFIHEDPHADDRYAPHMVTNDRKTGSNVLSVLQFELADCTRFDFSVAFITSSGIQVLVEILAELERRHIPGRILTSTYLNFNDPEALRKLLEYPNIECRVYQGQLHAKGYVFDHEGLSTIIVGSSNLTQTALTCNREWNVLFRSTDSGEMFKEMRAAFSSLWSDEETVSLSQQWIDEYESYRASGTRATPRPQQRRYFVSEETLETDAQKEAQRAEADANKKPERLVASQADERSFPSDAATPLEMHAERRLDEQGASGGASVSAVPVHRPPDLARGGQPRCEPVPIQPNRMQVRALEALGVLHRRNQRRALLISATGTGKTYLSALDVRVMVPRRVLYIAHRRRILMASMKSFERVLGSRYTYGLYGSGSAEGASATCVFAMVGTLARHLEDFDPSDFDYLIIDEAHRSGAESYQRVLAYFTPKFCLGMTATPTRTDGYDVYQLFNHTIAYRITLQDALDNDMLAPFHYFGIADLEVDDEAVDDVSLFGRLTSEERVRHVIQKIEEYSVEKSNRRGLIFCNRNAEAAELSRMFNERGYRTAAISGETSDAERDATIARLEAGELQYIFSVDILNEGVDIPSLNQIIMLRRTESPIVFVQQLGRGLRKCDGKEYTLVLDFIGNYQQNYLVPIALSGDRTYNKDNLRKVVKEGNSVIPGASTISFDKVSEGRIFRSLEEGRFSEAKLIKGEYQHLKQVLGHIPSLVEYDSNEAMDPLIIFKKYGSYAAFLQRYEPDRGFSFGRNKLDLLRFISQKIANGKRREDLEVLERLVMGAPTVAVTPGSSGAGEQARVAAARAHSVEAVLSGAYSTKGEALVVGGADGMRLSPGFSEALEDPAFRDQVLDAIRFGLGRNDALYRETYKDTDFVLDAKYTREEVCRLLRWEKEPNYQNIGGYFYDRATNTFPVFINYEKDASKLSITTLYEDRFVSERELIAISKSNRTMGSPEIKRLASADANGMRCFLFVRKNKKDKDDGTEFYFLGEMHPTGMFRQFTMKGSTAQAVEIGYRLEVPVRADLYDYFLSDFDEDGQPA